MGDTEENLPTLEFSRITVLSNVEIKGKNVGLLP